MFRRNPNTAPACIHSTVFLPTIERGLVSSTRRSAAERAAAASDDTCNPGAMAPPRNSPLADTTSTQIAEPKSTTGSDGEIVLEEAPDIPEMIEGDGHNYEVVGPPVGATVPYLPEDAEQKTIGGSTYFVFEGTYYRPFASDDETIYMVSEKPT